MEIPIIISSKRASLPAGTLPIICDNSDYTIAFCFDSEWDEYEVKTARFKWGGKYTDVEFHGNRCAMPIVSNAACVTIGVYAGALHTTTPAMLYCKPSILGGSETEAPASQAVRNEFIRVLLEQVGDLSKLQTAAKDNLVDAVNEAASTGGTGNIAPEDAVELLAAADVCQPVASADGKLYVDASGKIFVI